MLHALGFFGFGFFGLWALSGLASVAYAALVIWMIVDGILRTDAEYPGVNPNRKVLWVVAMVLLHPVAIVYFFMVYVKIKRAPRYTPCEQIPPAA